MPSFKSAIALLMCFTVKANPQLFTLEQDSLIITPKPAAETTQPSTPLRADPYFMDQDSYLPTEKAQPAAENRNDIEAIMSVFNRI